MAKRNPSESKFLKRYGPWSVVTGAASGIGREIAFLLAECGLNLALLDRDEEALSALISELREKHGIDCRPILVDLAREDAIAEIQSATSDLEIGLLVAAAGFGSTGNLIDSSLENELEMMHVNCRAVLQQTHHFAKIFAEQKRGGIILMSSSLAFQGAPLSGNYAATKAYVQSLAEALGEELGPHGVEVLASAPGPVATKFGERARLKNGRMLDPRDVAVATINALGKQRTILPGLKTKIASYSLVGFPRSLRAKLIGKTLHGMVDH